MRQFSQPDPGHARKSRRTPACIPKLHAEFLLSTTFSQPSTAPRHAPARSDTSHVLLLLFPSRPSVVQPLHPNALQCPVQPAFARSRAPSRTNFFTFFCLSRAFSRLLGSSASLRELSQGCASQKDLCAHFVTF